MFSPLAPQQWEYEFESTPANRAYTNLTDVTDIAMLQKRGEEGWELVSVVACGTTAGDGPQASIAGGYTVYYYFKRPKASP
jgi:hypothetical protein